MKKPSQLRLLKFRLQHRLKLIKMEFLYHKTILGNRRLSKSVKLRHAFCMIARRCDGIGTQCAGGRAYLQHSNCAYVDELSNYNYCCKDCHDHIDAMYQEMWDDYHSGRY